MMLWVLYTATVKCLYDHMDLTCYFTPMLFLEILSWPVQILIQLHDGYTNKPPISKALKEYYESALSSIS